ncbi:MAG TPA: hypothetical protein VGG06_28270 [Thermoanaerobaculia bacterium]|jgi:hypothetical protein
MALDGEERNARWEKVASVFAAALTLPERGRRAYLERRLEDDPTLRPEIGRQDVVRVVVETRQHGDAVDSRVRGSGNAPRGRAWASVTLDLLYVILSSDPAE